MTLMAIAAVLLLDEIEKAHRVRLISCDAFSSDKSAIGCHYDLATDSG